MWVDVVILQGERLQLRIIPGQTVPLSHPFEESVLGRPVEAVRRGQRIPLQIGENGGPLGEKIIVIAARLLGVLGEPLVVLPLEFEGGRARAVDERNRAPHGRVVTHPPARLHRIVQRDEVGKCPIFERSEHQGCRTELHVRLHLRHRGVSDDHVQTPVLRWRPVGLVPRVDDGSLQRGLEADLLLEEIRTLGQLEVSFRPPVLGT